MAREIRAFIGVIGSGKDYQCSILEGQGFTKVGFSDGVRGLTWKFLNWEPSNDFEYELFKSKEYDFLGEKLLGREILQKVGTVMRDFNKDLWATYLYNRLTDLSEKGVVNICVSDCRYVNEVEALIKFSRENKFELRINFCNFKSPRYELNDHESESMARSILDMGYQHLDDITQLFYGDERIFD